MGSADDPSLRLYDHITNVALSSLEALTAGTKRINLKPSGELPRDSFLQSADLIGVYEPDGGVAPLAMGEAWYRVANKL
jgi:hypothetical protein